MAPPLIRRRIKVAGSVLTSVQAWRGNPYLILADAVYEELILLDPPKAGSDRTIDIAGWATGAGSGG